MENRFYVYELIDSRDGSVFYVGKGSGKRSSTHVKAFEDGTETNVFKIERMREIFGDRGRVIERVARDGMTEAQALTFEKEQILSIGLNNLTNIKPGNISRKESAESMARNSLAICEEMSTSIYDFFSKMALDQIHWARTDWQGFVNSFYTKLTFDENGYLIKRGFAPRESDRPPTPEAVSESKRVLERDWDKYVAGTGPW